MQSPSDTLSDRVHELVQSPNQHGPILTTTGTRAAIDALAARVESLEEALREVAAVVAERTQSADAARRPSS